MNIHQDLNTLKQIAVQKAKEHKCKYIIYIHCPNSAGEFDLECGSTYEFSGESYFEKARPHTKIICNTDELIAEEMATKERAASLYK